MRVLKWMLDRLDGRGEGVEHALGITPRYHDLHWQGLAFTPAQYEQVASVDREAWREELALHDELFDKLKARLPRALSETKAKFESRLAD